MPQYQSTWDVQLLLSYLSKLNLLENLDLKSLTLKLVMLVALVSAQRGQSLRMAHINFMKDTPFFIEDTSSVLSLFGLLKSNRVDLAIIHRQPFCIHTQVRSPSVFIHTYQSTLKRPNPWEGRKLSHFLATPDHTKQFPRKRCKDGRWI